MGNIFNINKNNPIISDLTKFYGFYPNVHRDPFVTGTTFIFVTRPMLFFKLEPGNNSVENMAYINMTRDPEFIPYLLSESPSDEDKLIAMGLSYDKDKYNSYFSSNFIPMITNQCKSFDIGDSTLEQLEAFDTNQGFKEVLPTHKTNSENANTLSIPVTEDYNLSFIKMMKLWTTYISHVTDGTFDANPDMIKNGVIDYMCSIFEISVSPDGKTINHYSKYTGCWPTNVQYSSLRFNKGQSDISELELQFVYTVKEDMNPKILEEFNIISLGLNPSEFLSEQENELYSSVKESPYLNKSRLPEEKLKASNRDPVILHITGNDRGVNIDSRYDRFEIIFDDFGYTHDGLNEIIGNDNEYFYNDLGSNNAKLDEDNLDYQTRTFWNKTL